MTERMNARRRRLVLMVEANASRAARDVREAHAMPRNSADAAHYGRIRAVESAIRIAHPMRTSSAPGWRSLLISI